MSNQEDEIIYVVQPRDTLVTIAVKYNISVQWIKDLNQISSDFIYNGMKLKIKPPNILDTIQVAENVQLISVDYKYLKSSDQIKGKLTCKGGLLAFIPYAKSETIFVDLCGNLEHTHHPSPDISQHKKITSNDPELFVITFFPDMNDLTKTSTLAFEGGRGVIIPLSDMVEKQTKEIQKRMNFTPARPTPTTSKEKEKSPKKPKLRPIEMRGTSRIVDDNIVEQIRRYMPYQHRLSNWELLFQLSNDGASFFTFFEKCTNKQPCILLVRTETGEKIGAYCPLGFKNSKRYYGTGETFVFSYTEHCKSYRWQSSNNYFTSSTHDGISIGGGGSTSIWIDSDFLNGGSAHCSTFNSPCLTSTPMFKIYEVEVWSMTAI